MCVFAPGFVTRPPIQWVRWGCALGEDRRLGVVNWSCVSEWRFKISARKGGNHSGVVEDWGPIVMRRRWVEWRLELVLRDLSS